MLWFTDPTEETPIIDTILNENYFNGINGEACPHSNDIGPWCSFCAKKNKCKQVEIPCTTCHVRVSRYDKECWWCGASVK